MPFYWYCVERTKCYKAELHLLSICSLVFNNTENQLPFKVIYILKYSIVGNSMATIEIDQLLFELAGVEFLFYQLKQLNCAKQIRNHQFCFSVHRNTDWWKQHIWRIETKNYWNSSFILTLIAFQDDLIPNACTITLKCSCSFSSFCFVCVQLFGANRCVFSLQCRNRCTLFLCAHLTFNWRS